MTTSTQNEPKYERYREGGNPKTSRGRIYLLDLRQQVGFPTCDHT